MPGLCILSHGLNSSPNATKARALAAVAEAAGWRTLRPDYTDLDATLDVRQLPQRIARLLEAMRAESAPVLLAGSSLGAYTSALASLECAPLGLFLMAPPVRLPEGAAPLEAARVPTQVVHGWRDELIPAQDVIDWCRERALPLCLVDDAHRLEAQIDLLRGAFARFLGCFA